MSIATRAALWAATSLLCLTSCLKAGPDPPTDGADLSGPAADLRAEGQDLSMPADLAYAPAFWGELSAASPPPARYRHEMVYDSKRKRVVVFGGLVQPNPPDYFATDETWEWDGTRWEKRSPPIRPQARVQFGMIFDSKRGRIVIFGGATDPGNQDLDDTWFWDGADWSPAMTATRPPARSTMPMAYDVQRDRIVLFAGCTARCAMSLQDTWEFDGTDWRKIDVASPPPARRGQAMAYDEAGRRTLLFGGRKDGESYRNDTWQWDGARWTEIMPALRPTPMNYTTMVMDTWRGRAVMIGYPESATAMETWEFDGTNWKAAGVGPTPRRVLWGMTYVWDPDPARSHTLLFAGQAGGTSTWLSDLWAYR